MFPVHEETRIAGQDVLLRRFPQWSLAHCCVVIAAASFIFLAMLPEGRLNDFDVPTGAETVRVARSLAFHGAFADPFITARTGETAHVAPVYPFLYSLVLRALGTGSTALRVAWACNLGFVALQLGLLPLLSYRMKLGIVPGTIAAALGTFSLYAPIDTRWEAFLAGLLLLLCCLATQRAFESENRGAPVVAGVLWGILLLCNPVLVLLLAAWPLCWVATQPRERRGQFARRALTIAALAFLTVTPWILRDYARFGAFLFVRDNFGLELYTGNNPCAMPSIRENIQSGCYSRTHPNQNAEVAARLAATGEVQCNHAKLREALNWIGSNPGSFLRLTVTRFRLFWFPSLERWWEAALVWIVTLLSFAGLWVVARKNSLLAWVIATAWLLFPLVYYITQFEPRYRFPIYWTSLLPAGCALTEILQRVWRPAPSSP